MRQRISTYVASRLPFAVAAFILLSALSFGGRLSWLCDNLTAFVPQLALSALVLFIASCCVRSRRWALCSLLLAVVHTARLWAGSDLIAADGPQLLVATANVKTSNRSYDRFVQFARSEFPDLLAVIEIDDGWASALTSE